MRREVLIRHPESLVWDPEGEAYNACRERLGSRASSQLFFLIQLVEGRLNKDWVVFSGLAEELHRP